MSLDIFGTKKYFKEAVTKRQGSPLDMANQVGTFLFFLPVIRYYIFLEVSGFETRIESTMYQLKLLK